jgi:hypothetical protein
LPHQDGFLPQGRNIQVIMLEELAGQVHVADSNSVSRAAIETVDGPGNWDRFAFAFPVSGLFLFETRLINRDDQPISIR